MIGAAEILSQLTRNQVTHVVGVPDNGSRALFELLWAEPTIEVIPVTREGEAFALASGLYLGGKRPLVLIQNTGFLEAGDALRGTAHNMRIPLVILIGYRGYETMASGAERVDSAATFFEPTLKAWQLPYSLLHDDRDVTLISEAFRLAAESSLPAAVILVESTQ